MKNNESNGESEQKLINKNQTFPIKKKSQLLKVKNLIQKHKPEEDKLHKGVIFDSEDSIFQMEDDKSEYKKSQTFIQEKNLGNIPKEFKNKIKELNKMTKSQQQGVTEPKEGTFSLLPSLGEGIYGFSMKKLGFSIGMPQLLNYFLPIFAAYLLTDYLSNIVSI